MKKTLFVAVLFITSAAHAFEWTPAEERQIAAIQKQVKRDRDGAWTVERGNYAFRSHDARFTAEMAVYTALFEKAFRDTMPCKTKLPGKFKITVTAYDGNNDKQRNEIFKRVGFTGEITTWRYGWGWGEGSNAYFFANKCFSESQIVLEHELAHVYLFLMGLPHESLRFIHEGFASYFYPKKQRVPLSYNLKDYVNMSHAKWFDGSVSVQENGAASQLFMYFMMEGPKRRELLGTMLDRAFKGMKPLTDAEIKKLEPAWNAYMKMTEPEQREQSHLSRIREGR